MADIPGVETNQLPSCVTSKGAWGTSGEKGERKGGGRGTGDADVCVSATSVPTVSGTDFRKLIAEKK